MSKRKINAIGPIAVGCTVRVTDEDKLSVEGIVTCLEENDSGVTMTFKGPDGSERRQFVAICQSGPELVSAWFDYKIAVLRPAPQQQAFAGMRPAGFDHTGVGA